ncbi:MAG: efflux RND transporter periplasmic adaptor subunit [Candidatus Omnitrophica bacterium]|nr:efflux RND transporter periplasmic adaptor subunit [Candidatus Omnitrophota bacterium]
MTWKGMNMELDKKKILDYVRENKNLLRLIGVLILAMILTSHIRSCQRAHMKRQVPARPVKVSQVRKRDVQIKVESFGTLASPESVDIQAQVTGKIIEVNFEQGEKVQAGELLFTIDPQEYKAQVDQKAAELQESLADLKLKKDTLERNRSLHEKELISQQDFEQYQTDVAASEAKVELDKAALELAKINLNYCYIRSPVHGITGRRRVDKGNIVPANNGPVLVNVRTIDWLFLDFTLPENQLSRVRKAMGENTLAVIITVPGQEQDPISGRLELIDNTVDDSTGSFLLRAHVDNKEGRLWPGQFVKVTLILGTEKDAVVVPYAAVQMGKKGYYLFAVSPRRTAQLRFVTVGPRSGDDIVIEKGVELGERVVTVGQMGLVPDVPVIVSEKDN